MPGTNPLPGGSTLAAAKIYKTSSFPKKGITVSGYVQIYVTSGGINMNGNGSIHSTDNIPAKIQIFVTDGSGIDMQGNQSIYAQIYAPLSPFTTHGTPDFFGSLVAKSIDISGNAKIHYDESTDPREMPNRGILIK